MAGLVWTERHLNGREVPTAGRDHLLLIDRGAPLPDRLGADARIRSVLATAGVWLEMMTTGAAARTYNVLLEEGRSVGAALIAVE